MQKINDDISVKEHFGILITDDEINILIANCKASKISSYYDYWIPIQWSLRILADAKEVSVFKRFGIKSKGMVHILLRHLL